MISLRDRGIPANTKPEPKIAVGHKPRIVNKEDTRLFPLLYN